MLHSSLLPVLVVPRARAQPQPVTVNLLPPGRRATWTLGIPGGILNVHEVSAPRPRTHDFLHTREFNELYESLLRDFPT